MVHDKKIYETDVTIGELALWYCEEKGIEAWKDIPGFEGLYQTSMLGSVRSLNYRNKHGWVRVLKPYTNEEGRKCVNLHLNNKQKSYWVSILVAKTFIPNPDNLPEVNHLDEDVSNNSVFNLEWCSGKDNCNWGTRNVRQGITQKKNYATNKRYCRTLQYSKGGVLIKEWVSANEAATALGISASNIVRCCNKQPRYRTAGGYIWKYKKED